MQHRRLFISPLAVSFAAIGIALCLSPAARAQEKPVVFAAASLKNALDAVNASWKAATGKSATISYASSSALAKQIENGAPADIFFSADRDWMDYLVQKKMIVPGSGIDLLGNSIVLVAPKASSASIAITEGFDLKALLGDGKIAMGAVDSVPAGKYGKAALEKLGAWDGVRDQVAQAENVRAALLLVSRAEAPLGIVYKTDAAADPGVRIVGTFPPGSHPAIVYPVALTLESQSPDAAAFLAYLQTGAAAAAFEKQGFTVLAR